MTAPDDVLWVITPSPGPVTSKATVTTAGVICGGDVTAGGSAEGVPHPATAASTATVAAMAGGHVRVMPVRYETCFGRRGGLLHPPAPPLVVVGETASPY